MIGVKKSKITNLNNKEKLPTNKVEQNEQQYNIISIEKIKSKEKINKINEANGNNNEKSKNLQLITNNEGVKIKEKNSDKKDLNIEIKDNEINSIHFNLNKEYKGKKNLTGKQLIEIFKNPIIFQKNNIEKQNLFDLIYKDIDEFKKDIGYDNDEEQIIDLENKSKELNDNIKELCKQIKEVLENNKIEIKNIKQLNDNMNIMENFKDEISIYFELIKIGKKIEDKIKYYEENKQKLLKLKNSILNNENEVKNYINTINDQVQKAAYLINVNDIFEEYKKYA